MRCLLRLCDVELCDQEKYEYIYYKHKVCILHREETPQPKRIKYSDTEPSTSKKFVLKMLPKAMVKKESTMAHCRTLFLTKEF